MPPCLDAHSSAEVVKGSSAPAHWRSSSRCRMMTYLPHVSASHTHTQTLHLCVWVAPVLPWQPAAVSLFVCPWSQEQTHANAGAEIRTEGGRRTTSVRAFLFTSELTTPTALPPALTCQAANADSVDMSTGREERNMSHLWGSALRSRLVSSFSHFLAKSWMRR